MEKTTGTTGKQRTKTLEKAKANLQKATAGMPPWPGTNLPWPEVAIGVAAAAGGGLLGATLVGVGPAALAGVAGYLAYRAMTNKQRPATR
jgi:hypothetical protein